ncbi:1-deoxy-D-xylulose-5-phosphate reductoisomerase [Desulfamplus magnetovallimortis]|nr:1-deoxy-D-xylulose-5-phosphate reductoisomerase [Desulfamplus magnetovallimortis]
MKKRVAVLGSTGSIGRSALDVAAMHPDLFDVTVLACANNVVRLAHQIQTFKPEMAVVLTEERADELKSILDGMQEDIRQVDIVWGEDGYAMAASHEMADAVLLAMVGAAGLMPALAAIEAGKHIALANKETLVMAGEIVMARAAAKGITIYPVDSEHSAIFQCLEGNASKYLKKIFLTASGGPFRNTPLEKFKSIRPEDALNHPTWDMGSKITIDSATLMNKALEVVEAVHLFNTPEDKVDVIVHPQSIVHSMVGFKDGSIIAQMGLPDMRAAISYALAWPERLELELEFPDFASIGNLLFEAPDTSRFPSLEFAREACRQGGTLPAVMNASNEIAVQAFLDNKISFPEIFDIIEKSMADHRNKTDLDIKSVLDADKWAREKSFSLI